MMNINVFRRTMVFFLSAFVILTAWVSFATADVIRVRVTARSANVHLEPAPGTTVIDRARFGQELDVLDRVGSWYRVLLPPDAVGKRIEGYIIGDAVELVVAAQPSPGDMIRVRVTARSANVHLGPAPGTTVIDRARFGQELDVLDRIGSWYRVSLPPDSAGVRNTGYVFAGEVELIQPEEPDPWMIEAADAQPPVENGKKQHRFSIVLKGGMDYLGVGDINTDLASYGQNIADMLAASPSGSLSPIHYGPGLTGELQFSLWNRIGVAFGLGYMNVQKESRIEFTVQSHTLDVTGKPGISVFPVHLSLVFEPARNVFLKGGAGYYFARCKFGHRLSVGDDWVETGGTANGTGIGFHGGLALVVPFSPRLGLVIEGMGRHVKLNNFNGKKTSSSSSGESSSESGDLYYYETSRQGQTYGRVLISKEEPMIGSAIRKAEVDLSGFSISVGLKLSF